MELRKERCGNCKNWFSMSCPNNKIILSSRKFGSNMNPNNSACSNYSPEEVKEVKIETEKLKPCPYCGGEHINVQESIYSYTWDFDCPECFVIARFSHAKTFEKAKNAWNRRDGEGKSYDLEG